MWNDDLIQYLFPSWIGTETVKLFLHSTPTEDTWIWESEKRCIYSVRSSYRVFKQLERAEKGEPSDTATWDPIWKTLWSLKLPTKIRVFVWKAGRDSLPTRKKLYQRQIQLDTRYPFCPSKEEDLFHAIYACSHLLPIWSWLLQQYRHNQTIYLVHDIMQGCLSHSSELLEKFIPIAWRLWLMRNTMIFENQCTNPLLAAQQAISLCTDYKELQAPVVKPSTTKLH